MKIIVFCLNLENHRNEMEKKSIVVLPKILILNKN